MHHQRVADVMTTDVATAGLDTGFKEIVTIMTGRGVTAVPVIDGTGHVQGMVTESDLLRKIEYSTSGDIVPLFERPGRRHARHKAEAVTAARLMTTPAITVTPETTLVTAAKLMSRRKVRRLPVTDEYGTLAGLVSRGDLISVYTRPDERIAEDVRDQVLRRALSVEPGSMELHVEDGVVDIAGRLERRTLVPLLVELVRAVDGVVDVVPHLTYRHDDTVPDTFIGA